MKANLKRRIYLRLLLAVLFILPLFCLAQDPGDPGGDPDIPIDGGVGWLIAAGVGYGLKKYRDSKNYKNNQ